MDDISLGNELFVPTKERKSTDHVALHFNRYNIGSFIEKHLNNILMSADWKNTNLNNKWKDPLSIKGDTENMAGIHRRFIWWRKARQCLDILQGEEGSVKTIEEVIQGIKSLKNIKFPGVDIASSRNTDTDTRRTNRSTNLLNKIYI